MSAGGPSIRGGPNVMGDRDEYNEMYYNEPSVLSGEQNVNLDEPML